MLALQTTDTQGQDLRNCRTSASSAAGAPCRSRHWPSALLMWHAGAALCACLPSALVTAGAARPCTPALQSSLLPTQLAATPLEDAKEISSDRTEAHSSAGAVQQQLMTLTCFARRWAADIILVLPWSPSCSPLLLPRQAEATHHIPQDWLVSRAVKSGHLGTQLLCIAAASAAGGSTSCPAGPCRVTVRTWVEPEPEQEADSSPGQLAHGEQRVQYPEGCLVDRARHIPRPSHLGANTDVGHGKRPGTCSLPSDRRLLGAFTPVPCLIARCAPVQHRKHGFRSGSKLRLRGAKTGEVSP